MSNMELVVEALEHEEGKKNFDSHICVVYRNHFLFQKTYYLILLIQAPQQNRPIQIIRTYNQTNFMQHYLTPLT